MQERILKREHSTKKEKTEKCEPAHAETEPEFILLGIDVYLNKYVVRRQVDGQGPQPAQTFRSVESLLRFMGKQVSQAGAVYSCYEAGPLGYGLHRQIESLGVTSYVVKPRVLDEEGKRRKGDGFDSLGLVRDLERYVRGNEHALCVIRVPDLEEERLRSETRMRESWTRTRRRLESQGRGILLY
jgi:transposase